MRELTLNFWAYFHVFRSTVAQELEFRLNYIVLIFSCFVSFIIEYAIFLQVFSRVDEAGGLRKEQALSFVLLGLIVRNVSSIWAIVPRFVEQIRDGSFRKYLIQPVFFPAYFYSCAFGEKFGTWMIMIASALILKFAVAPEAFLSGPRVPGFVALLILQSVLMWQIYLSFVYVGFWIEETNVLAIAFNMSLGIFSGTAMPLGWLPEKLQALVFYTPLPNLGHYPLQWGLGNLPPESFSRIATSSLLWILALVIVNKLLEKRSFRRFEASGG